MVAVTLEQNLQAKAPYLRVCVVEKGTDAIPPCRLIKPHNSWDVLRILTLEEYTDTWYAVSAPEDRESGKYSMDERVHRRLGREMQGLSR
jgi:hypothetical protein